MATTEGGKSPAVGPPPPADADVVITTVVSADDARPTGDAPPADDVRPAHDAGPSADPEAAEDLIAPLPDQSELVLNWDEALGESRHSGVEAHQLAALEDRLAALEGVPAGMEALGKAMRHELERCAGVLFGHDRALAALAARLDAVSAPATGADVGSEPAPIREEALGRILDQFDRLSRRLGAVEARIEPLEPVPTVVQALRRAVRAGDDLIAGEARAREEAMTALASQLATEAQVRDDGLRRLVTQDLDRVSGIASAQAKGLADVAERLAAAESRLTPLASLPDDVAALSRIVRRELDAVITDNQARDQMLRRALQNEIDQLRATSEAREALATELTARLEAVESRSAEVALASEQALAAASGRLEALEERIAGVDQLGAELVALRDTLLKELEELRVGGNAHDQLAGELTRRLSALDSRLSRLDSVPGELQSLRTAMLQEAERSVGSLRAVEERLGQLSWVPGEFQEARKRIMVLTSGLQSDQDRMRQLEGALASTNERLDALRTRFASAPPREPDA